MYNPELELKEILEEERSNAVPTNPAGVFDFESDARGFFPISPPSDPIAFATCLQEANARYEKGISSRNTKARTNT
jgi:hypothetical protein